jgi:cytochrome c553
MKVILGLAALAALAALGVGVSAAAPPDAAAPLWAFPGGKAAAPPAGWDTARKLTLPGSGASFTEAQLHDLFVAPDWRPAGHPAMPGLVAAGHRPDAMACAFCHTPTGVGRPENAALAGLPAAYIAEQVEAFASGARTSAVHGYKPSDLMIQVAKATTPDEARTAAAYFSALPFVSHVQVREVATVARPAAQDYLFTPQAGAPEEPIGDRIVETAVSMDRFERRDPESDFVAYVPVGSLKRGETLAKAQACASCHGGDLRGGSLGPPLAGRSPSYLFRQLLAFQVGARAGAAALPMKAVTAKLSSPDMVALAAYAASRKP